MDDNEEKTRASRFWDFIDSRQFLLIILLLLLAIVILDIVSAITGQATLAQHIIDAVAGAAAAR